MKLGDTPIESSSSSTLSSVPPLAPTVSLSSTRTSGSSSITAIVPSQPYIETTKVFERFKHVCQIRLNHQALKRAHDVVKEVNVDLSKVLTSPSTLGFYAKHLFEASSKLEENLNSKFYQLAADEVELNRVTSPFNTRALELEKIINLEENLRHNIIRIKTVLKRIPVSSAEVNNLYERSIQNLEAFSEFYEISAVHKFFVDQSKKSAFQIEDLIAESSILEETKEERTKSSSSEKTSGLFSFISSSMGSLWAKPVVNEKERELHNKHNKHIAYLDGINKIRCWRIKYPKKQMIDEISLMGVLGEQATCLDSSLPRHMNPSDFVINFPNGSHDLNENGIRILEEYEYYLKEPYI